MQDLVKKRKERDAAFDEFLRHNEAKNIHDQESRSFRHKYMMIASEVREMERDILNYNVLSVGANLDKSICEY